MSSFILSLRSITCFWSCPYDDMPLRKFSRSGEPAWILYPIPAGVPVHFELRNKLVGVEHVDAGASIEQVDAAAQKFGSLAVDDDSFLLLDLLRFIGLCS